MFKTLAKGVQAAPAPAQAEDDVQDHQIQAIEAFIDSLDDTDPSIAHEEAANEDVANLRDLRDHVAKTEDCKALLSFANRDGALSTIAPSVPAVEAMGEADLNRDEIVAQIDSALTEHDAEMAEGPGIKIARLITFAVGVVTLMMGVVAALTGLYIPALAALAVSSALAAVVNDGRIAVVPADKLGALAKGVSASTAAIVSMVGMAPPKSKSEADAFVKRVVSESKAFSAMGMAVSASGDVSFSDFPDAKEGTLEDLGYKGTVVADISKEAHTGAVKLAGAKSAIKAMGNAAALKAISKDKDLTSEDATAIYDAVMVQKKVISSATRRVAKAVKFITGELKQVAVKGKLKPKT